MLYYFQLLALLPNCHIVVKIIGECYTNYSNYHDNSVQLSRSGYHGKKRLYQVG